MGCAALAVVLVDDMQKALIVANGRSLKDHLARGDFDVLEMLAVPTIAMNRIDWLYEPDPDEGLAGTVWRPTYWVWVEWVQADSEQQHLTRADVLQQVIERHILTDEQCWIATRFRKELRTRALQLGVQLNGVHWMERADCRHGVQVDSTSRPKAWHLPSVCPYGGTITAAYHLAWLLGATDVGVLGADLGLKEPDWVLRFDYSHFHSQYFTACDGDLALQDDTLRDAHRLARKQFTRHGRRLVNVGIDGLLDVLPRMGLEEWLCSLV
jgi:hypothetical protein